MTTVKIFLLTGLFVVAAGSSFAQQVTLSMGSGAGALGAVVNVDLAMTSGAQPAGLQWRLTPGAGISSVTFAASAAATAAGKTLSCNANGAAIDCVLFGLNSNVVANGVVATAAVTISPAASATTAALALSNMVASSATGTALSAAGTSGSVNIAIGGAAPPGNGPMTPGSGTSMTRTFQWTGVNSILYTLGIIDASNGKGDFANNCVFQYMPGTNQISLSNDSGAMQNFITLGAGSLSNSKCTLNSAASSRSVANGTLSLNLSFSFAPSFTGIWPVFVAYRAVGADSPTWGQAGSWTTTSGTPQQVATPTFNPPGGTYGSSQLVSITSATPGASIRYTTDGTTPTSSVGTLYSGGVTVASSQTLKAIAYAGGMSDSPVATAAYSISVAGTTAPANGPMTPSSGTATTRTFQWPGVSSISYVLGYIDASNGNGSSANNCIFQYMPGTNQITLSNDSGVMQNFITLGSGSLSNGKCTLNSAASSRSVVNGTLNLTLSFNFSPSFYGTWPVIVAYRAAGSDSPIWAQIGSWTVSSGQQQQQVATPTFSPAGGTYSISQLVRISTTTAGTSIRYTTDGSTPTASSGTLYSGGVNVATSQTLKAIAYASGMADSAVATANYTINNVSGPPGNGPMTPASGTATTRTFQWTGVNSILYTLGIIDASNGRGDFANNCIFQYMPGTNQISLSNDSGAMQNFITLGSGSLSNSKCTLNSAASSRSVANGTLSLTLSFTLAYSFRGTWPVFVAYRAAGSDSPTWAQVGSWTR